MNTAPHMTNQLVVFSLGHEQYGLSIQQVQEIIRYSEPRSVDSGDPWVRGVISLRGKIIPVLDLALRINAQATVGQDQKIIVVETASGTAGVVVDEVEEVLTVSGDQIDVVPGASSSAIDSIAKVDDRLIVLLDPDVLFAPMADLAV